MRLRTLLSLIVLLLSCPVFGVVPVFAQESTHSPQVRFIRISGAHAFSARELKKIMETREKRFGWLTKAPLDEQRLEDDLTRLGQFYKSKGFYHMSLTHQVVPLAGSEVQVEIAITEGPPMVVQTIELRVDGETTGPWHQTFLQQMPLQPGARFTIPGYQDIEKIILRTLGDWGRPKARVDLKARLDKGTNLASVFVDVVPGPVCTFGPVRLEGNERVSDEVIRRELRFKEGDRYSAAQVQESQQRLFGLDLFEVAEVNVEGIDGEARVLPVRVLVKESRKQTIRLGAGYGTEDQLRGQAQWEIRDFLGDGRRLQVNAKGSSLVQLLEGEFTQPYLFDLYSTLVVNGGVRHDVQESYENRKFYLNPVVSYRWTKALSSTFGYDLEANRLLHVAVLPAELTSLDHEHEEYFVGSLVQGTLWERVDDPLNPRRGFRLMENIDWASVALGSEVDFIKLTLEGRGYLPIKKYGVLAARLKWGGIETMENTETIPIFKRFFAGGTDSVRGYPYQRLGPLDADGNPVGGMTVVEGSLEWRFPIPKWKALEGVFFFDFGNVYADSYELLWDDLRYTAGCGVRYLTLVGPLRLDVGYELNPPEPRPFAPYQIHFSIGQAF